MKSRGYLLVLVAVSGMVIFANERIDRAIDDVMHYSCLSNRHKALSAVEHGVPMQLYSESSFTNLVAVMTSEIQHCGVPYLAGLTNIVRRRVFIAALANCGRKTFRKAIVGWFGGTLTSEISPSLIWEYVTASSTRMEQYFIMRYDEPEIRNVWMNIKNLYLASNDVVRASWMDSVLSGKSKAHLKEMRRIEAKRGGAGVRP